MCNWLIGQESIVVLGIEQQWLNICSCFYHLEIALNLKHVYNINIYLQGWVFWHQGQTGPSGEARTNMRTLKFPSTSWLYPFLKVIFRAHEREKKTPTFLDIVNYSEELEIKKTSKNYEPLFELVLHVEAVIYH